MLLDFILEPENKKPYFKALLLQNKICNMYLIWMQDMVGT